ncbi:MAG: response regulator [Desulfobacterales bacterium]|nr:response regulator [Desulfobacterales bacterium]
MKDKPVILIVDDQPQDVELLEAHLVPQGYEIVKAASGEEALEKLSGNQIELILMDVLMPPGMDGFEVTRRIRRDTAHRLIPIILITALQETEDRVKGIEAGCDDFLSKPLDKMELFARVRSLLQVKAYNDLMRDYQIKLEAMVSSRTEELRHSLEALQQEIAERKRMEEERQNLQAQFTQAQKMESIGRLAGGVAHDFNNKLTIINGYAELAIDMMDPSDPLRKTIQEIHTAGNQSALIVRQLLAFARQQTISPVLLDLNNTISSMLKMLQRLIGENIDLAWHPGSNLWPVKIDPGQVDQVMANLAVNSRDAISDVGKLTIETKNTTVDEEYCKSNPEAIPGRYVMLAVSDDGCGIETEVMGQLFEPFFTTKEIGKGTGLGLPTVYGIVKQNEGFINVYSEPGEGTTFKIYLPSQEEAEKSGVHSAKKSTMQAPMGTETILIVEDEKAILQLSRRMIEGLGYTVLIAGNPSEALQLSKDYHGSIDLLITDVVMPEMNGWDLSSQLAKNHPGLKTLFMSGYTANVIAHHGMLDEGLQFIQKPFSLKDLAVKVREVLEQE